MCRSRTAYRNAIFVPEPLPQGDQLAARCEWGRKPMPLLHSGRQHRQDQWHSVCDTIRFVLSAKRPVVVIAGVG